MAKKKTNLKYNGKVNITVNKKKYKSHNAGADYLFELFARFLSGYKIDPSSLPRYITIKAESVDGGMSTTILNNSIMVTTETVLADNQKYATRITATLVASNIAVDAISDYENFELWLLNSDDIRIASTEISSTVLEQVVEGRQAVIEWFLQVDNEEEIDAN